MRYHPVTAEKLIDFRKGRADVKAEVRVEQKRIGHGTEAFDVTIIETTQVASAQVARRGVLFAVGRGGNPSRHLPLLRSVSGLGCRIVAPHFRMLESLIPTKEELDMRIRRLQASADDHFEQGVPLVGIGHSIGTVTLLALVGAEAQTFAGEQVIFGSPLKFDRLALLAPPTDFFRRPGALGSVTVQIRIWAGARDVFAPPAQAEFLKEALEDQAPVELRIEPEAGHFSYMNELPPHIADSHPDRSAFLARLAEEVGQFVVS